MVALRWADSRRLALGGHADAPPTIRARDEAGPRIAQQILVYPVTQADVNLPSYLDPENQGLLSKQDMEWFWNHYLPDVSKCHLPGASPLHCAHLSGLPPAVVVTAEHDVVRNECELFADALEQAGIEVERKRFVGQLHGFFTLLNVLPASEEARVYIVGIVRQRFDAISRAGATDIPDAGPVYTRSL
jgi:acetyl esterase